MDTTFFFIRHGESEGNVKNILTGNLESELTVKGKEEAIHLKDRMKQLNPCTIYTSNSKRTIETAEIINEDIKVPIKIMDNFNATNFGVFQGLTQEQVLQKYPQEVKKYIQDPMGFCPPEGESFINIRDRIIDGINQIVRENQGKKVMVVTHGFITQVLFKEILKMPLYHKVKFRIISCGVNVVTANEEGLKIESIEGHEGAFK